MPPETGNCFESAAKLPVSGGIKMSVLMPPETGNCFESAAKLPVWGNIKNDFLRTPEWVIVLNQPLIYPLVILKMTF